MMPCGRSVVGAVFAYAGFIAIGESPDIGFTEPAWAESVAVDKSQYSLFDPVPESDLRSFSPDRPAKSTDPYTVDAGHFQYEADLFNYTYQKTGGVRTTTWFGPDPTFKIGLTNTLDFEVNIAPFEQVDITDQSTGLSSQFNGVSDLFFRAKINVWGNDGGTTAFALIPYLKAPTAPNGIGNGATEGGFIVPLNVSLPNDLSLLLNTELDILKDGLGDGYHTGYVNIISLSGPIVKDVTLTGELWSSINQDPSDTIRQYSFDTAIAWTVRPNLQLDAGANVGLNRETPAIQAYAGVAQRF